jgi:hypothetical protein
MGHRYVTVLDKVKAKVEGYLFVGSRTCKVKV